jgi:PAS domain S-box-containing protein
MFTAPNDSAPAAGQAVSRLRPPRANWHYVHFLLAAFVVLTVSLSLFLNHQLVETHKRTIQVNLQWVSWLMQCDILSRQAADIHVQGSDVLASHDVPKESGEMDAALSVFNQSLSTLRGELQRNVLPADAAVLLNDCAAIHDRTDELTARINSVFALVRNGQLDQTQSQVTPMNRDYDIVLRAVDNLRSDLRAQRQTYLERQLAEARAFQRYEWLLGLLVVAMVIIIRIYGVRLDRHISASESLIRETQDRYRLLVEQSTDGIVIADDDWNFLFANQPACQMYGYTPDEMVHLNAVDTYLSEDRHLIAHRKLAMRTGESARYERFILRKDGSRFLAEIILRRLPQGGNLAVIRDITERKHAEEAPLQLAAIVESSHDAIVSTDLKGIIASWNAAAEHLYGYTAGEIIGQSIAQIIPEERHQERTEVLRRISTGEHVSHFESSCITRDGRTIPVSLTVSPLKDASGNIVGTSAIIHDITERKRKEEQLRLQSAALEAAANAIVITDSQGIILWVNPAFTSLTGWSREEVVGKTPRALKSGRHDSNFYRDLWETVTAGRVWQGEMTNRRKDGSLYTEEMTITPVRDGAGAISRFIAIKQDVTRRKKAEQSLLETNTRLAHALEELQTAQQSVVQQERLSALGTMAGGIAHDFNNALAAILGFSELLLYRPEILDDRTTARQYLEMMNTAAKDAGNVVNRLREFYRHRERGEVFTAVDLNRLVQDAISLTQPKWKAQAEARSITISTKTELPEIPPVSGNAADLREVLTNLIFNAVDAMPHGGVITIRTRSRDACVTLEVADTGTGMTAEVRKRCLEPFFTTKGDGGTGLGLSMVYGIVQRHEGTIDIHTQLNKGTTFVLTLPAHGQPQATVPTAVPAPEPAPLTSKRVLLVDDEEVVRKVLNEYLIRDGHVVELAANGKDGLDKFRHGRFDVVILDRAMPDMSGDQVGAAIKHSFPNLPVIMLTGFGSMMEAADEKPVGVDFIVSKPVTIDTLRRAIARAVGNN